MRIKYVIFSLLLAGGMLPLAAQENNENSRKKAWEFGLGGTVFHFNRVSFGNFSNLNDGSYMFDLKLDNAVYGGNLYIARELSSHFYLDLSGSVGYAGKTWGSSDKNRLYTAGLGLQWRLGEYFQSRYIDPYLRIGAGYMYKNFMIYYTGAEGPSSAEMEWWYSSFQNKSGADRQHLTPVTAGMGINMWLNDHWGIGIQGNYVLMPYKNVANSLQGSINIIYRLGGKSKKSNPAPVIQYVDRPIEVERIVEKVVEVEKIVEVPGRETLLVSLFNNIYFDFNRDTFTDDSQEVLNQVAEMIKKESNSRFLVTGFTDARGSSQYNQDLSEQRAKAVVEALVARGVPKEVLKSRGVAGHVAVVGASASDEIRSGDRKVTIEIITSQAYWDYLR